MGLSGGRIRVGISSCILGERVRYDGGHRHDRYITDTLGRFFEFVPVCPEVECGLPTPRESMRLVGDPAAPRLVTVRTRVDHTGRLVSWASRRVIELERESLCGFIFKSHSPSSGMERVKVYDEGGMPSKLGIGAFARVFMEHFPLIPTEDEGRLHDPDLRENFIERVFALERWRALVARPLRRGGLVAFHTENKLLLLSHSPKLYRELGRLVAESKSLPPRELFSAYEGLFSEALRQKTTVRKHTNVLQHMMGYFKNRLTPDEKKELSEVIAQYANRFVPLVVPVTLIQHYVRKYDEPYLKLQRYLEPHPVELALRNHS